MPGSAPLQHTGPMIIRCLLAALLGMSLWLLDAPAAFAAAPAGFTASYNVSRNGQPMGVATVSLHAADDGTWVYRKSVKGTSGIAAALGASVEESSVFRWSHDVPQAISYDYRLQSMLKNHQRHLRVDWDKHQVHVDDGDGPVIYPASPGMVERNTVSLALGVALRDGKQQAALPVAVRQRVETHNFSVVGNDTVTVPAGRFEAQRVERTDADHGFSAWYVPKRYPIPVKLTQRDGGNLMLELVSYEKR